MRQSTMRVLIDARMLLGRMSGVARVVTRLVEHLARRDGVQPVVLCGDEPFRLWEGRSDIEMLVTDFRRKDRTPLRRLIWEESRLAGWIQKSRADVYHATWNSGVPPASTIPVVVTIHDLIPWARSARGLVSRFQRGCYRLAVSRSVRRATVVTAVSDYSRGRIVETLGMDRGRILTIRNGVALPKETQTVKLLSTPQVSEPFVLYVGGHERRKNIAALIRAMCAYWRDYDAKLTLALTGTRDALCPQAREAFDALAYRSNVRFLGFPSDDELDSLYHRARMLLLLSTDEGFGLPVLEAMARGCPVVAANRASLPEVVGNAGVLVEPEDTARIAAAIHRLSTDRIFRSSMAVLGLKRAKCFTWEHTCESMVKVYMTARRSELEAFADVPTGVVASQKPAGVGFYDP